MKTELVIERAARVGDGTQLTAEGSNFFVADSLKKPAGVNFAPGQKVVLDVDMSTSGMPQGFRVTAVLASASLTGVSPGAQPTRDERDLGAK